MVSLVAFCVCSQAFAAPRMALVVRAGGAGSDKAAAFVTHNFQVALEKDSRYDLLQFDLVLGNPAFERADQAFAAARVAVSRGKAAYEEFELDAAKEHLRSALNKFQRHSGHLKDYAEIAQIYMLLGAIYSLEGAENKARTTMADAWAIYPHVVPDPRLYNPAMREHFQAAVEHRSRKNTGGVSFSSNPSYARIYIDGTFRGVTPSVVDGLTPGQHHVRVVKDGFRSWGRVVRVKPGRTIEELAKLRPTDHFDDFDALAAAALASFDGGKRAGTAMVLTPPIEEIGTFLDIDQLMLVDVRLDGETVRVYAAQLDLNAPTTQETSLAQGEQLFAYTTDSGTYTREIDALIDSTFSESAMAKPNETGPRGNTINAFASSCLGMKCSSYKATMVWTTIGVGLAAAGTGAAMWAIAKSDNDTFRAGQAGPHQASAEAADLKSSGETKALVGDILIGVGVSAVLTGTLMQLLWYPGATVDDVMSQTGGGWGLHWVPKVDGGSLFFSGDF